MIKLALALLLALPVPAKAECMMYGLAVKLATPGAATLPVDGGVVVYTEPLAGGDLAPGDPALVPTWKIKGGGKLTVTSLAPGLAVIQGKPGTTDVVDARGSFRFKLVVGTEKRKLLDAPKAKAVVHSSRRGRRGGEDVHVELEVAPPSTAIAIVLLDEASKPKSWGLLTGPQTVVAAYSASSCIALPNGTRSTNPGDLVQVAFVDAAGRMSAASKPLKVTAKPSPAQP